MGYFKNISFLDIVSYKNHEIPYYSENIIRGGNYIDTPYECIILSGNRSFSSTESKKIGFRVVRNNNNNYNIVPIKPYFDSGWLYFTSLFGGEPDYPAYFYFEPGIKTNKIGRLGLRLGLGHGEWNKTFISVNYRYDILSNIIPPVLFGLSIASSFGIYQKLPIIDLGIGIVILPVGIDCRIAYLFDNQWGFNFSVFTYHITDLIFKLIPGI